MEVQDFSLRRGPVLYKALLLYRDTNSFPRAQLACAFDVSQGELTNGKFLTDRDLKRFASGLYSDLKAPEKAPRGSGFRLLDPRVIGTDDGFLCFEIPAHRRSLFFGPNLPQISKKPVPLPRLVAVLVNHSSYLFAVKSKCRISDSTRLYNAPIPENDLSGRIHDCGIRWPKKKFSVENVDANTDAILDAQKLNSQHSRMVRSDDYAKVIEVARKNGSFPASELIPSNQKTLGEFVKTLSAR